MRKQTKVTQARLDQVDHYRAQVQLNNKLVWAVCYNAIYDSNPVLASHLRDTLAAAIEKHVLEHTKTLVSGSPPWSAYFKQWVKHNIDPDDPKLQKEVNEFIKKNLLDA